MDCREGRDLIAPYFLGSLEPEERSLLEEHLDACSECNAEVLEAGEAATVLALSVEQVPVPASVKEGLFARIEAESRLRPAAPEARGPSLLARILGSGPLTHPATALASVLLVVVVGGGGVLFNARVDGVVRENDALRDQLGVMATASAQTTARLDATLAELAEEQKVIATAGAQTTARLDATLAELAEEQKVIATAGAQTTARLDDTLAEMAEEQETIATNLRTVAAAVAETTAGLDNRLAQTVSVNVLEGSGQMSNSRVMVLMTDQGAVALLAALDLPPLPPDRVYQVWLVRGSLRYSAGIFTVDPSGFGQALIRLVGPLGEFDAIAITIEPRGGSQWPTSTTVLRSDL